MTCVRWATPSWRRPRSTSASPSTRSATSRARWSGWASTSRADRRPPDERRMARPPGHSLESMAGAHAPDRVRHIGLLRNWLYFTFGLTPALRQGARQLYEGSCGLTNAGPFSFTDRIGVMLDEHRALAWWLRSG